MRIERFEDIDPPAVWRIEAWQLARKLARKIHGLTKRAKFSRDFGLKGQIQDAPGSSKGFSQGSGLVKVNKAKATLNHACHPSGMGEL